MEPFSREEIGQLLKAAEFCNEAETTRRCRFVMRRPTARRDQALILVLLDIGLRSSELCLLKVGDVNQKTGKVSVKHGPSGGAKGSRGRVVYLGKTARRALWRYLTTRDDGEGPDAPLFLGKPQRRLNKGVLRQLIARLGRRLASLTRIRIASDIRLRSLTCARAAMCSPCRRYSGTAPWRWSSVMPALPCWIWSRHTAGPARWIIGIFETGVVWVGLSARSSGR